MLCYFRQHLQFPSHKYKANNLPMPLLNYVAKHLDIDIAHIDFFDWNTRSTERYRQNIREYLGYRIAETEDIA